MIDTLQKMSGTTHRSYVDSKTVTRDNERLMFKNEGKTSYTMTTREEPVIKYNDMAFIGERNSIVFRAGDNPIWNRNETILPMSWRLFKNNIKHPGHTYSLQTIPTLSTVKDFDVRKNQPDFMKMVDKRLEQALESQKTQDEYRQIYNYGDYEIEQLDPDDYADSIMEMINTAITEGIDYSTDGDTDYLGLNDLNENGGNDDYDEFNGIKHHTANAEENVEQKEATQKIQQEHNVKERETKRFAEKTIASDDLISLNGQINHSFDQMIIQAYVENRGAMENDANYFVNNNGNLCDVNTGTVYIRQKDESESLKQLKDAAKDKDSKVYAEENADEQLDIINNYIVTDDFYKFLAKQSNWDFANGVFESSMARLNT